MAQPPAVSRDGELTMITERRYLKSAARTRRNGPEDVAAPSSEGVVDLEAARKLRRPVARQAWVRSITVDHHHQAPCVAFDVPHLRRGEEFCRVRTRPPTDVRRTRFGVRRVELVIYGPVFWKVGDATTLELEPYPPALDDVARSTIVPGGHGRER